jgi:hypothetical protein
MFQQASPPLMFQQAFLWCFSKPSSGVSASLHLTFSKLSSNVSASLPTDVLANLSLMFQQAFL